MCGEEDIYPVVDWRGWVFLCGKGDDGVEAWQAWRVCYAEVCSAIGAPLIFLHRVYQHDQRHECAKEA